MIISSLVTNTIHFILWLLYSNIRYLKQFNMWFIDISTYLCVKNIRSLKSNSSEMMYSAIITWKSLKFISSTIKILEDLRDSIVTKSKSVLTQLNSVELPKSSNTYNHTHMILLAALSVQYSPSLNPKVLNMSWVAL